MERITEEHRQEELERRAVEQIESADFSECYPLGGMVEPYDIEREKELIRKHEKSKN